MNDIEQLTNKLQNNLHIKDKITDSFLWNKIIKNIDKMDESKKLIKFLLEEFGTKEPCNRFDVGNTIEFILGDLLRSFGFDVKELPNAKRVDLCINNDYYVSIKYSSSGDITLHNSNSSINKDNKFTDLILLTTNMLYLITNIELAKHKVEVNKYLKNTGDSLKLKRSLLRTLEKKNYPYIMKFDITIDKKKCKNRLCSKLFYQMLKKEFFESSK